MCVHIHTHNFILCLFEKNEMTIHLQMEYVSILLGYKCTIAFAELKFETLSHPVAH